MSTPLPAPTQPAGSRAEVLVDYLDFFRARVIERVTSLADTDRRSSRLPSGWTPLELVRHLTFVERRWLIWGFLGEDVGDPWGDEHAGRWFVGADEQSAVLLQELVQQGRLSARVATTHDLAAVGVPGPRWDGAPPATLERVLLHLLQEYARHLGQLDVVVELVGGGQGE